MPKNLRRKIMCLETFLEVRRAIVKTAEVVELSAEEMAVGLAVLLGTLQQRPMDISALAEITGQKFSTCHRNLRRLREAGYVVAKQEGTRIIHYPVDIDHPIMTEVYAHLNRAMRKAKNELEEIEA